MGKHKGGTKNKSGGFIRAEGDESAFNKGRYYRADGSVNAASVPAMGGANSAPAVSGIVGSVAPTKSLLDNVKSEASNLSTLVQTDKAYTGLAIGISAGLALAFYVNKKKHYGVAGYLAIAAGCGLAGYGIGTTIKGGGIANTLRATTTGTKDEQITSKVNALVGKAVANAGKLNMSINGSTPTATTISDASAMIKTKLPTAIASFTDKEKDIAIDSLGMANDFIDKAIADCAKGVKADPLAIIGQLAIAQDALVKKYSQKEIDDFSVKVKGLLA